MEIGPSGDRFLEDSITFPVDDPSRAGEVRRAAVALAARQGFSEVEQGRVAIVATEAATNLSKHAQGGEIILRSLSPFEGGGMELLSLDRGPGITNIGLCLQDGYSTAGTSGNGLGSMQRLSDDFDISSTVGAGTVIMIRFAEKDSSNRPAALGNLGAICLPLTGEEVCGDGWAVKATGGRTTFLMVDGLGHGPLAATAAHEAIRAFHYTPQTEPTEILEMLHAALRATRGAAVAVAEIDPARAVLRFAGVGNIAGTILGPDRRQGLVSMSGTIGHTIRKVQTFEYQYPTDATLVLHSDGLGSQWDLTRHAGIMNRHPSVIAGSLYRDYRRPRDDVTVLVVRDLKGQISSP
ncbi:SpoIIE family protein phosphatase [Limnoglobus roseus]|uniref:Serine/threonine protein kinase n=1 Tax=Limnoglobus roseus TaxID=2598579 RepID=A0A5C1AQB7_9BACT|nr:SpoIIE family protein phosphatase [Limnoglobus roseus]QEL20226.1 serine/threonine protein kinase [Limnoglobus roseus]